MQPDEFFEFEGFQFRPHQQLLLRIGDKMPVSLTPQQSKLLTMLAEKAGEIVTYEEMKNRIWAGSGADLDRSIKEVMYTLRKALGKSAAGKIETVSGRGYRLTSVVTYSGAVSASTPDTVLYDGSLIASEENFQEKETDTNVDHALVAHLSDSKSQFFAGYFWQIIASSTLYALLYSIALFIEIAYLYDIYKEIAWRIAPFIFLWILGTSTAGYVIDVRQTIRGKKTGMMFSLFVFIAAALFLYFGLGKVLPRSPITEAEFQTHTAFGAYFKNTYYFLPLAVFCLIIPFHFVVSLQRELQAGRTHSNRALLNGKRWGVAPKGSIYLRVWWLVLALIGFGVLAVAFTAHLFENLKPNAHLDLFMDLAQWRLVLYFTLGIEAVFWYHRALNELKHRMKVEVS